jgi:pyruvate dehydrogenase E2 component (dihydrolipoamide acetyltransferase)
MATEFKLPDLGENIKEADVLKVLVAVGDAVTREQPIIEVETDKAIFEVPSEFEGRITAIHVSEGETVEIGQPLITLEEGAPAAPAAPPAPAAEEAAAEAAAEEPEPAPVEAAAAVAEEQPAEQAPAAPPLPPPEREPVPIASAPSVRPAAGPQPAFAAPSVRQFAREIGIDIHSVRGSGPGGRISLDDVKEHARRARPDNGAGMGPAAARAPEPAAQPLPDFEPYGGVEREPMSRVRRTTAEAMARSWATIPHVTLFQKADITHLEEFRQRYRAEVEAKGGRLTFVPIMLKIVAEALKAFSIVNASVDMEAKEVVRKGHYHLGMAVDTPRGLLVPVLRDVDQKNIVQIAIEVVALAEKAREGKLTIDEMRGATFTVSNLGFFGTGFFTPIINHPEVGVLGVGRGEMEPVWIDGEFRPRMMLPLSLSHDHRLIDGADGARFLRWIVRACSDPLLLVLGVGEEP